MHAHRTVTRTALEVMMAIEVSARSGRREAIVSNPERPTAVPLTARADWTGSRGEAP